MRTNTAAYDTDGLISFLARALCFGSACGCLADGYPKTVAGRGERCVNAHGQMVLPSAVGGRLCWPTHYTFLIATTYLQHQFVL